MTKALEQKINSLNIVLRSGKHPRGSNILGAGSGNFYQCIMSSSLALRAMKRPNKRNREQWDFYVQRIDKLVDMVKKEG